MLKITITSTAVREMKGIGKASGKAYHFGMQTAWVHTHEKNGDSLPFPEKIDLMLDQDKDGAFLFNAPGEYTLHPSSIYVDQNGRLAVAPRLIPAAKKA